MTMMPEEFADLEPFAEKWCLASEPERYATRLATSMPELQTFYDAVQARAAAAIDYCDRFPLDEMPETAVNLMHLLYSFIVVSFSSRSISRSSNRQSGCVELRIAAAPQLRELCPLTRI